MKNENRKILPGIKFRIYFLYAIVPSLMYISMIFFVSSNLHLMQTLNDKVVLLTITIPFMVILLFLFAYTLNNYKQNEIELIIAREAAQESVNAKNKFLTAVSHELRTPLNAIIGFSESFLEEEATNLRKEQMQRIGYIQDNGLRLLELVNDVIHITQIENHDVSLKNRKINLLELIREVIAIYTYDTFTPPNIRIEYDPDLPLEFITDKKQIITVVKNIVDNALKFSSNGRVEIYVTGNAISESKYLCKISIKDYGIGISKDRLERIFEKFVQLDMSDIRKYRGTGLGLALSKEIVKLMGGDIGVESVLGQGSTFWFTIPLLKKTQTPSTIERTEINSTATKAKNSPLKFNKLKILVVEDDPINRDLINHLLCKMECHVTIVANGLEAVNMVDKEEFALIFMDCQMPIMDGYEATKIIRKSRNSMNLPIVAVTANTVKGDQEKCISAGMNDYISKPIKRSEIELALNKWSQGMI